MSDDVLTLLKLSRVATTKATTRRMDATALPAVDAKEFVVVVIFLFSTGSLIGIDIFQC
jgi:hypothetical protein